VKTFNLNADEWDRTEEREGWRFKDALAVTAAVWGRAMVSARKSEVLEADVLRRRRRSARLHEAALVCEHDRLCAVVQIELAAAGRLSPLPIARPGRRDVFLHRELCT
jgi:hypothetical protein